MKTKLIAVLCTAVLAASCSAQNSNNTDTAVQTAGTTPAAAEAAEAAEVSEDIPSFELTSADLHDGVWDSVITNTKNGSNVSPQLSWEKVEGAECYVVYMVDTTAGNWLHWKSGFVTDTELAQGAADKKEYVGPYPPGGTHTYEIYVYALGGTVDKIPGVFDSQNKGFFDFDEKIGEQTEILACGHISGTYTKGD